MKIEWKEPTDEISREFYICKRNFYLTGLLLGAFIVLLFDLMLVIGGILTSEEYLKKKCKEVLGYSEVSGYSGIQALPVLTFSNDSKNVEQNDNETSGELSKSQKQELIDSVKKQYRKEAFLDSLGVYILAFLLLLAWVGWLLYRIFNLNVYRRKAFGYLRGTVVDKSAEKMLIDKYRMNYYVTLKLEGVDGEFTSQISQDDFYDSKMGTAFYATHFNKSDEITSLDWAFKC